MQKYIIAALAFFLFSTTTFSKENGVKFNPYGYISYEIIYDTYRSLDTRDGELYLFPKKPNFDSDGNDINKRSKLNMITVQSRAGLNIESNDILGAKTTGRFEVDFFGTRQDLVRMVRLRQAMVMLQWENTELLMGHTFHPMFVLDCFPGTVSFAAAVPFHPLNRSPQVRLTQQMGARLSASASFLMHGYHRTPGPDDAQRNSGLPDSQLQIQYNPTTNVLLGFTVGYKFLSPRDYYTLEDGSKRATDKTIGSYNLQAFSKITTTPVTIKLEGVYGENLSNFIMIGGYGAKGNDSAENPFDWETNYDYANLNTLSLWADIHSNNSLWQWGVFAGYTENMGSNDPYIPIQGLSRYDELSSLFRISPRLTYFAKNLSFGFEYSYYSAVYASQWDANYKPTQTMDPAINHHLILQAKYSF